MSTQYLVDPDQSTAAGTPPTNGTGGERGSSALQQNSEYTAAGVLKNNVLPTEGPLRGSQYYNDPTKVDGGRSARTQGAVATKTAQSPS